MKREPMLCTICDSDKHVAASCPRRPKLWRLVLAWLAA